MKYSQIITGIIIGTLLGYFVFHKSSVATIPNTALVDKANSEMHEGIGRFTNPLLECLGTEDVGLMSQLYVSEGELSDYVNKTKASNNVSHISVYVRDLNNGPWIGISEDERFIGGSLLKVPILISYYKLAESNPSILKKKIKYTEKKVDNIQYFFPSKQIELGKTYTVEELLEYMIKYSDNSATNLLVDNIDKNEIYKTFEALGMGKPDINLPYPVDVKTYAGFFRILFNASYLTQLSSEKALELLSDIEFNQGITAELPKDTIVSHKFGIRGENDILQLHDCGIVYYPNHPYLLCVMSKGGNFGDLSQAVSEVSKFIYDKISTLDH